MLTKCQINRIAKIIKGLHLLGLILFLGSILTFIMISVLAGGADPATLAFARRIILTGTQCMTMPGAVLAVSTGLLLAACRRRAPWPMWLKLKLMISILVLANASWVVMPAVMRATSIAVRATVTGQLDPGYYTAYARESVFGAFNVLLILLLGTLAIWKPGRQPVVEDGAIPKPDVCQDEA